MTTSPLWIPDPPSIDVPANTYRWATVADNSPLTVRLDGDTTPLEMVPESLVDPLTLGIGSRVWVQIWGKRVIVLGTSGAISATYATRAQAMVTGGGIRTVSPSGVSWGTRFIVISAGLDPVTAPAGHFNIDMPPDGTVIPQYGDFVGTPSVTVTAGLVPLSGWENLYYELPLGNGQLSDPSRFRVVDYQASFRVPASWIFVCGRRGDANSAPYVWGDRREQDYWRAPTLVNSWANYGSGFAVAGYKRENGRVRFKGLIKSGTTSLPMFTLPVGYRPLETHIAVGLTNVITSGAASAGTAHTHGIAAVGVRIDVEPNGDVSMINANAANGYVSIHGIEFDAEQ